MLLMKSKMFNQFSITQISNMINDIFQNLDNSYQDLELSPEFKENLNNHLVGN